MRKILLRRSNRSSIGRAPTDMAGLAGRRRAARWRRLRAMVVELICLLLLWELLGVTIGGRSHILPTPINVAQVMWSDRSVLATALRTTSGEALWGFVVGNAVAIILGVLSVTSRRVASVVVQLGVVSYCLPIVAVGPILIILLSGALPQEVLAGIAVVFTTLVLTVEGLQSASVRQREVINAFGGLRVSAEGFDQEQCPLYLPWSEDCRAGLHSWGDNWRVSQWYGRCWGRDGSGISVAGSQSDLGGCCGRDRRRCHRIWRDRSRGPRSFTVGT